MLSEKSIFSSSESLYGQLKASAKSVLLTSIKFKEAMYADEEEQSIKNKYKPINPQYRQHMPTTVGVANCNGHQKEKIAPGADPADDIPKPKVVLFPPEKVELHWKEIRRIGPGLCNLGNTCFLNSVLQVLTYTAPLVNFISSDAHRSNCETVGFCMLCELRNHFFRVLKHNPQMGPIRPLAIVQKLSYIGKQFKFGRQEDAHEFLRYVLDGVQKSCLAGKPKLDKMSRESTVINQIFGGFYRSQVICLACKHRSNTYDPMLEMNLDIKESNSVENALRRSVRPERLDGENKYQCDRCRGKQPALKRSTIHKSPNVFTVQFKRFDFNRIFGGKISKHVTYSEELNLRPFMSVTEGQPIIYRLFAVLVHSGFSCNSGHYYCYVKAPNGAWYEMNDSRVSQVSIKTVLNSEAYLLFYIKKSLNRDKNIMNGNKHSNHNNVKVESFKSTTTVAGAVLPPAGKQMAGTSGGSHKNPDSTKQDKPCSKLIPLNFNDAGMLSFKIANSNKKVDTPKLNKGIQLKKIDTGSRNVEQKMTDSNLKTNVVELNMEEKSNSASHIVRTPALASEQKGIVTSGIERLKEYSSDSGDDDEFLRPDRKVIPSQKSDMSVQDKGETGKVALSSPPFFGSGSPPKTVALSSQQSTVDESVKLEAGVGGNERSELKGGFSADSKSIKESVTSPSEGLKLKNEVPLRLICGSEREGKAPSSSSPMETLSAAEGEAPISSTPNGSPAKHIGKSSEDNRCKASSVHSKAFLFSPPLVPAIRPWLPTRHSTVARTIYKRSFSEPDPLHRKRHQDLGDGKGETTSENIAKANKWHTSDRQVSEHLFGPMTPPLKDSNRRERTNSVNSEASSVASVSSKVGEWEVHEKEPDAVIASKKIPERQFAGWEVKEQKDDVMKEEERWRKNRESETGNAEDSSLSMSVKKKKKKKKKKREKRPLSSPEEENDKVPLLSEGTRKRQRGEEDDDGVKVKKAKKKDKKKDKKKKRDKEEKPKKHHRSEAQKWTHESTKDTSKSKRGDKRPHEEDKRPHEEDKAAFAKLLRSPKRRRDIEEEGGTKDSKELTSDPVRCTFDPVLSSSRERLIPLEERGEKRRSLSFDGNGGNCSSAKDERKENGPREERRPKEKRRDQKDKDSSREYIDKWRRKDGERRRSGSHNDSDSEGSVSRYKTSKSKKGSRDRSASEYRYREGSNCVKRRQDSVETAPSKRWDDGTLSTPKCTSSAKDILDTLFKDKARALGSKVRSWDGNDNEIDSTRADDERRRKRDKWDEEYDEGRSKKVKSLKQRWKSKSKTYTLNPFQKVQDSRNTK